MDRISVLRAFTRLVERGSFTAVAQELRVEQSTVSKWIRQLEDELDLTLVDRTTRSVRVTDAGRRFHEHARVVVATYDAALDDMRGDQAQLAGRIRLNVSDVFGRLFIVPSVARFLRRHRELELDLSFGDSYVSLVEEGYDLSIRIGAPVDSSLTSHPLGTCARRLVASAGYLRSHGTPAHPRELAHHACLIHTAQGGPARWRFRHGGRRHDVAVSGRVCARNSDATRSLARSGFGVALLASWLVDADIASGRLVALLPEFKAPPAPIRALTPPGRRVPARVRALLEHLRAESHAIPS